MLKTTESAAPVEDTRGFNYKTTVREMIEHFAGPGIGLKKLGGFFRELIDVESTKCYGTQRLTEAEIEQNKDRYVGFYGGIERVFTAPFEVQRGHKIVTVKASPKNPITCREHIYPSI